MFLIQYMKELTHLHVTSTYTETPFTH